MKERERETEGESDGETESEINRDNFDTEGRERHERRATEKGT